MPGIGIPNSSLRANEPYSSRPPTAGSIGLLDASPITGSSTERMLCQKSIELLCRWRRSLIHPISRRAARYHRQGFSYRRAKTEIDASVPIYIQRKCHSNESGCPRSGNRYVQIARQKVGSPKETRFGNSISSRRLWRIWKLCLTLLTALLLGPILPTEAPDAANRPGGRSRLFIWLPLPRDSMRSSC